MKRKYSAFLIVWFCAFIVCAQPPGGRGDRPDFENMPKGKIIGVVLDETSDQPIEYATIALFRRRDSSLASGAITKPDGSFLIETRPGRYFAKIEFIAYESKIIDRIGVRPQNPEFNIGTIRISPSAQLLKEAEIVAEKGQLSIQMDKKVFNVDKDISSIGGTATEVLENIPSVSLDIDGNVSLRGSNNVRILIDGKPSGLTGISTADVLEQLPANSIESVEVITNPSARYDAEGMAGILNIILKKNKKKGFNGMLSLTGGFPENFQGTLNLNYGGLKYNLFGTYNVRYHRMPGIVGHQRITTLNGISTRSNQNGDFERNGIRNNLRIGGDLYLNDKNTITLSGIYGGGPRGNTRNTYYRDYNETEALIYASDRVQQNTENNTNYEANVSYQRTFNSRKHKLNADLRYSRSFEDEYAEITQNYLQTNLVEIDSVGLQRITTKDNQWTVVAQIDYTQPFGKDRKIELGYKSTLRKIGRDYLVEEFDGLFDFRWENQIGISNDFKYREDVHAGYFMFSDKLFKKLSVQLGLRAEQTYVTSELINTAEVYKKEYFQLFPTAHFSYDLKKNWQLLWSYSRRIRRPSFWNLNPFTSYADPMNLWIGNPDLNPELTHSAEIGTSVFWKKASISGAVYYRHTDHKIQRIKEIDREGISTTRPQNLSAQDAFGIEGTFSWSFVKWWKINGSVNYFRAIIDGGNLNSSFQSDFYSWTARINSVTNFTKNLMFQVMFNYRAPRETVQGTRQAMYFMDVALKAMLFKRTATLSFRVGDVFNSRIFQGEYEIGNTLVQTQYQRAVRRYILSFTYNFNRYKQKRERRNYGGGDYEEGG